MATGVTEFRYWIYKLFLYFYLNFAMLSKCVNYPGQNGRVRCGAFHRVVLQNSHSTWLLALQCLKFDVRISRIHPRTSTAELFRMLVGPCKFFGIFGDVQLVVNSNDIHIFIFTVDHGLFGVQFVGDLFGNEDP